MVEIILENYTHPPKWKKIYKELLLMIVGDRMGVLDRFRRNTIDKLKLAELREEEMRLKNQVERLRKDIMRLEKEKKKKFQEGVGADLIKKKMLAQEIKQLDMEAKMKLKTFLTLHKQYMFISNLVTLKRFERQLRKTPLWEKITSISPEQFESALIRVSLSGKAFEDVLDDLNRVFEMGMPAPEEFEDESEKELFEAWSSVEAGTLDLETAEKIVSVERELEERSE